MVYFKLLKRIIVHKFWVAYYCFQVGLYWQGLIHDLSKFSRIELNTSESNEEKLKWKIQYCKHFGIEPDYVNESPLLPKTKKPFFSLLLDDRAGLESAYNILFNIVSYANFKSNK